MSEGTPTGYLPGAHEHMRAARGTIGTPHGGSVGEEPGREMHPVEAVVASPAPDVPVWPETEAMQPVVWPGLTDQAPRGQLAAVAEGSRSREGMPPPTTPSGREVQGQPVPTPPRDPREGVMFRVGGRKGNVYFQSGKGMWRYNPNVGWPEEPLSKEDAIEIPEGTRSRDNEFIYRNGEWIPYASRDRLERTILRFGRDAGVSAGAAYLIDRVFQNMPRTHKVLKAGAALASSVEILDRRLDRFLPIRPLGERAIKELRTLVGDWRANAPERAKRRKERRDAKAVKRSERESRQAIETARHLGWPIEPPSASMVPHDVVTPLASEVDAVIVHQDGSRSVRWGDDGSLLSFSQIPPHVLDTGIYAGLPVIYEGDLTSVTSGSTEPLSSSNVHSGDEADSHGSSAVGSTSGPLHGEGTSSQEAEPLAPLPPAAQAFVESFVNRMRSANKMGATDDGNRARRAALADFYGVNPNDPNDPNAISDSLASYETWNGEDVETFEVYAERVVREDLARVVSAMENVVELAQDDKHQDALDAYRDARTQYFGEHWDESNTQELEEKFNRFLEDVQDATQSQDPQRRLSLDDHLMNAVAQDLYGRVQESEFDEHHEDDVATPSGPDRAEESTEQPDEYEEAAHGETEEPNEPLAAEVAASESSPDNLDFPLTDEQRERAEDYIRRITEIVNSEGDEREAEMRQIYHEMDPWLYALEVNPEELDYFGGELARLRNVSEEDSAAEIRNRVTKIMQERNDRTFKLIQNVINGEGNLIDYIKAINPDLANLSEEDLHNLQQELEQYKGSPEELRHAIEFLLLPHSNSQQNQ